MSLEHAFDLWDWTNLVGLIGVGVLVGYALLPYAWPDRRASGRAYPALMTGILMSAVFATFFASLIAFRYASGMDPAVAAKTVGTGIEGVVFAVAAGVGLNLRAPETRSTSLADLAAQMAELRGMAAAANERAELAYTAASAADDRVIGQAERAVDDRARGIRIEDVSTDTNHRAQDIQERLP